LSVLISLGDSSLFTKRTPPGAEGGGLELLMLKVSNHISAPLSSIIATCSTFARRTTAGTGDGLEESINRVAEATAAEVTPQSSIAGRARMPRVFSSGFKLHF
jgi:hypothetical protein